MRTHCRRCGYLTLYGRFCLYCQLELAGRRVLATLGEPYDGFNRIAHPTKSAFLAHGNGHRPRGTYHMTLADHFALGGVKDKDAQETQYGG